MYPQTRANSLPYETDSLGDTQPLSTVLSTLNQQKRIVKAITEIDLHPDLKDQIELEFDLAEGEPLTTSHLIATLNKLWSRLADYKRFESEVRHVENETRRCVSGLQEALDELCLAE